MKTRTTSVSARDNPAKEVRIRLVLARTGGGAPAMILAAVSLLDPGVSVILLVLARAWPISVLLVPVITIAGAGNGLRRAYPLRRISLNEWLVTAPGWSNWPPSAGMKARIRPSRIMSRKRAGWTR